MTGSLFLTGKKDPEKDPGQNPQKKTRKKTGSKPTRKKTRVKTRIFLLELDSRNTILEIMHAQLRRNEDRMYIHKVS